MPAYGTDRDYFSKPSVEDMVEAAYGMMSEGAEGVSGGVLRLMGTGVK